MTLIAVATRCLLMTAPQIAVAIRFLIKMARLHRRRDPCILDAMLADKRLGRISGL